MSAFHNLQYNYSLYSRLSTIYTIAMNYIYEILDQANFGIVAFADMSVIVDEISITNSTGTSILNKLIKYWMSSAKFHCIDTIFIGDIKQLLPVRQQANFGMMPSADMSLIIVDEISLPNSTKISILNKLIKYWMSSAKFNCIDTIFLGDIRQLPAVRQHNSFYQNLNLIIPARRKVTVVNNETDYSLQCRSAHTASSIIPTITGVSLAICGCSLFSIVMIPFGRCSICWRSAS